MKKNLLTLVIGTLDKGGAERVVSILSKEFLKHFSEVEIVTWIEGPICYEIDPLVRVTCIPSAVQSKLLIKQMWWFRNYIKVNHPDQVLSFLEPFNLLVLVSLLFVPIPVFVADRANPKHTPKNWVLQLGRRVLYQLFAKRIIVQSESNKLLYPKCLQTKMKVIPNPVYLTSGQVGMALRTSKKRKIVTVGRLNYIKNQEFLISAFAHVLEKYPDLKLVIYGEGSLRSELERSITRLNITHAVELPGNVDYVHEYISDAELFVFPSIREGMPNALIEAMALGLPVISSNISAVSDFVFHNENGILFSLNSEEELVECIIYLLNHPDKKNQIAQQAVLIAKKLSLDKITSLWLQAMLYK